MTGNFGKVEIKSAPTKRGMEKIGFWKLRIPYEISKMHKK